MAYVYILISKFLKRFYVGQTIDLENGLMQHAEKVFSESYTAKANEFSQLLWFYKPELNTLNYTSSGC
ncbi:MAG: GIY-YIG nuclease family protein [Bacteroidales bacterium]|nr:GIY-YIG nuclease family protein [Bacteroidales bacterium]MCF8403774.1 GIY-YIG nuclease family protein [Bacteroidales bacterium]